MVSQRKCFTKIFFHGYLGFQLKVVQSFYQINTSLPLMFFQTSMLSAYNHLVSTGNVYLKKKIVLDGWVSAENDALCETRVKKRKLFFVFKKDGGGWVGVRPKLSFLSFSFNEPFPKLKLSLHCCQ